MCQHSFHPTESTTDFGEADALDNLPERFTRSVSHDGVLFLPDPSELQALHKYCNAVQMEVLSAITKDASAASDAAKPKLLARILKLPPKLKAFKAYTEVHAAQLLRYIRDEAPIIIHIPIENDGRMEKLLADTHYRNQFSF